MAKRVIVKIDEEKCTGCGACITGCHEGALQLVNGKAKLVKESYCDGLGACLGTCPMDAISLEERESQDFDQEAVKAHMAMSLPTCPSLSCGDGTVQWPIQLYLQNPLAPCFEGADLVLAADCTAYRYPDFQNRFGRGKVLSIACPKLDQGQGMYIEKIRDMVDEAKINTITVVRMEVPCCGGLLRLVNAALQRASRHVPVKVAVIDVHGNLIKEEWQARAEDAA